MVMKTGIGALADNEARFVEIYGRFARPIEAYCVRRTPGSQVADAVSDIFLVAWQRIDQIPVGDEALPWLYGVAYRVLSHQWRHNARSRKLIERLRGLAEVEDYASNINVTQFNDVWGAVIAWMTANHPDDTRTMYTDDMSHPELDPVATPFGSGT